MKLELNRDEQFVVAYALRQYCERLESRGLDGDDQDRENATNVLGRIAKELNCELFKEWGV